MTVEELKQAAKVISHDIGAYLFDEASLGALIAAVRAENATELARLTEKWRRQQDIIERLRNTRLTVDVIKLRDDEASPVAAPCALAGACQYEKAVAAQTLQDAAKVALDALKTERDGQA